MTAVILEVSRSLSCFLTCMLFMTSHCVRFELVIVFHFALKLIHDSWSHVKTEWMPGLSFGYVIIQREINNIRKLCKIVLFLRFQQIQWFSVFQDTLKRVKDTPVRDVFSQADPGWKIYCTSEHSSPFHTISDIDINLNKGRLLELYSILQETH